MLHCPETGSRSGPLSIDLVIVRIVYKGSVFEPDSIGLSKNPAFRNLAQPFLIIRVRFNI
jgi:hypothetical protein